jgi:hypothetical protein
MICAVRVTGWQPTNDRAAKGVAHRDFDERVAVPSKLLMFLAVVAVTWGEMFAPTRATAEPPGFPDVKAFAPVDPGAYIGGGLGNPSINFHFATPDGVVCRWPGQYPSDPNAYVDVRCSGNIPGIPDSGGPGCAQVGSIGIHTPYVFTRGLGTCPPFPDWIRVLDVGQSVSDNNVTCLVGTGNVTGCIDDTHNRGFVLQPSGSWVF